MAVAGALHGHVVVGRDAEGVRGLEARGLVQKAGRDLPRSQEVSRGESAPQRCRWRGRGGRALACGRPAPRLRCVPSRAVRSIRQRGAHLLRRFDEHGGLLELDKLPEVSKLRTGEGLWAEGQGKETMHAVPHDEIPLKVPFRNRSHHSSHPPHITEAPLPWAWPRDGKAPCVERTLCLRRAKPDKYASATATGT